MDLSSAGRRLRRWSPLLLFLALSLALKFALPSHLPVGPAVALGDADAWVLSPAMAGSRSKDTLYWRGSGPGVHTASRVVPAGPEGSFLALRACLREAPAVAAGAVLLASENGGALDFNRHYFASRLSGVVAGECATDLFPRRDGDGDAIVQIVLLEPDELLAISGLSVTPMEENPRWRQLRIALLPLGIGLVLWMFVSYLGQKPRLLGFAGLGTVMAFLFGCCVSVGLKADIYALLSGGRQIIVEQDLAGMLLNPFPMGGFSLFTLLHGVLFAFACVCLEMLRRGAWLDLLFLGAISETLQIWVPGRGPGISDMLVDWTGVTVGLALVLVVRGGQRVRLLLQHQRVDEDAPRL